MVQFEHADRPSCVLYVPGLHRSHPSPSCSNPTSHWQNSFDRLPTIDDELPWHSRHVATDVAFATSENVLTLHRLHALAPIDGLYRPLPHAKQAVLGINTSPWGCNSAKSM
jgi:hypothetical protein